MITTAVNTYSKPSFIQPAYSVNGVSVQSDKTSEPSHRFLFDIYVDNVKVGRLKSLPSYNNYTSVEISDIVKNYVESEFTHITPRSVPNDSDFSTKDLYGVVRSQYTFLPKIKVLAGEEYKVGGVLTTFNGKDNPGEPEVEVAQWFSTYQAMDANSEQALVGRGGITNNQFQAQHLDVLEFIHQSGQNSFEWFGDYNYQYRTDNLYKSGIWKNYNVRELTNKPLERTLKLDTPSNISYYEGQHITTFNKRNPSKDVFDNRLSTFARDFNSDPLDMDPLYTTNANIYRQRIQTIGYQFYDPSGLEVGEVRYQPVSPIFDQPIKDGFNFDSVDTYDTTPLKVSEFLQVNVGAAAEYTKYDTNSLTDVINIKEEYDFGDFRNTEGWVKRPSVRYREGDKVCEYTPPSYSELNYGSDLSTNWIHINTPSFSTNGGQDNIPYQKDVIIGNLTEDIVVDWDFLDIVDRIEIIHMGVQIFDSGYVSGTGSHQFSVPGPASLSNQDILDWMFNNGHILTIRIYRDFAGTKWYLNYNAGNDGLSGINLPLRAYADVYDLYFFKDVSPLQPTSIGDSSQTSTFSGFLNVNYFNNIGKAKNIIKSDTSDLHQLRTGEHFYILDTNSIEGISIMDGYIIGVDNQLGELYGDRYNFLVAPCLRVFNDDENRWCNQDELERLTGRALESLNFMGSNGRPAIEVLEATPLNQLENGFDKQLSITFRINRGSGCPNVSILPGFFYGVYFKGMATDFISRTDRLRLMYGTDKSLRNANNYKVNIYDYDNHYNLINEDYANGGKFIYNMDNMNPISGLDYGVWTPGNSLPYWTYGVNGNYFGSNGATGTGYLNSQTEQRIGYVYMNNISTTPGEYSILKSNTNAMLVDESNLALSYLLKEYNSMDISQNRFITSEYLEKYGNKIYVQASCMVYVEDTPEAVDFTYLSVDYLATGSGISNQEEIYRAQDKGRWKRIHRTIGVPISQFSNDPSTQLWNTFGINVNISTATDANVWNGKYIDISDFRVNFLFGESAGLSETDNAAHKVYTKDLKKLNWGKEPHYTFGGDMLRNEAYSLHWINPFGAWDDYRFTGRSLKTTEVKRESRGIGLDKTGTLNSDSVSLKQNYGDDISYKTNAYETYELTSDYLTEEEREWMEELFISPKHYIYDENKKWFIRVNLLNKEYSTIKKNNQKLYQIKIEVQVSSERRTQQVLGSL